MCSLCGVLGCDDHWTSAIARPGVYTRNTDRLNRRREAANRIKLANVLLEPRRLKIAEWQGASYVLSSPTGRTQVFESLAHLWPEAEAMTGRALDPLDPDFLERLKQRIEAAS
ncbi:hypothetical protein NA8A_18762 [Nitratireductor indicus C115]|uniref:Uncharacterized protein n=1 Tax=Nitratireductor indicus C115 TaxID=1231190 RepID=K2PIH4_9HYPH|nr:hypothetical protein [Nitratireductor indicus]EKF40962.1 hypothetical protein NA8A_18762 [Nitratireductor indicus C115]SFQ31938.1 hypothetical protein SAMN05216176_102538 [Nitratireductor indicus]